LSDSRTRTFYRPAAGGYRALLLLQQTDEGFLRNLATAVWDNWVGAIVQFTDRNFKQENKAPEQVLVKAYSKAPNAIIDVVLRLTDAENRDGNNLYAVDKLEPCWDGRIAAALLQKAKDLTLKPSCFEDLLNPLLRHGAEGAKEFALESTQRYDAADSAMKERARIAATSLVLFAPADTWGALWPIISIDDPFGKSVIVAAASSPSERHRGPKRKSQSRANSGLTLSTFYMNCDGLPLNSTCLVRSDR
jgi:hypothetical protein